MDDGERRMNEMSREEAMRRLGTVGLGRVVFTSRALPAIRPVAHLIEDGHVIIRTDEGLTLVNAASAERGTVVAYQADELDPVAHTGWSVVITGLARLIDDPQEAASYEKALRRQVHGEMGHVIRIYPELVKGVEFVADDGPFS
jgi:nitroimidazol reductase NimA-like FMN-containing flavoprotein (pyridoxamine 5'-phosphate oxidase superfamily)